MAIIDKEIIGYLSGFIFVLHWSIEKKDGLICGFVQLKVLGGFKQLCMCHAILQLLRYSDPSAPLYEK